MRNDYWLDFTNNSPKSRCSGLCKNVIAYIYENHASQDLTNSTMIFDRHANLKYKNGSRGFWRRGYYVDAVGRNKKVIE